MRLYNLHQLNMEILMQRRKEGVSGFNLLAVKY